MAKGSKKKAAVDQEVIITLNGAIHTFKDKEDLEKQIATGFDPTNITGGTLKDGYCNYTFEIVAGLNSGKKGNFDGKTCLVTNDMTMAFRRLRPHMAFIDDLFKINGVHIIDIDSLQNHELTQRFTINGFKIKGTGINETVVIFGEKFVEEVGDHVSWSSPKITIGENSRYRWADNLNAVVKACREEVRLYHHGKYTKEVAIQADPDQTSLLDPEQQSEHKEDFEKAEV